jgi:saccharopine dehydrogenase-like NADP-dependent oxidoreductase
MNNITGLPLAIGALMMGQGKIKAKGVQAPEGCVDPGLFLSELGKRGVKVYEGDRFEKVIN